MRAPTSRIARLALGISLTLTLLTGIAVAYSTTTDGRTHFTAYFLSSNGIYPGDDVVILGVRVGQIATIEPQPQRAKITFWVYDKYKVPADAKAVILSPKLITSRAIQLTPAYTGGSALANGSLIPLARTAVPMEFDDLRQQLQKLTDSLQPSQPGGVSPLGSLVNTAADNLRGQGTQIRDMVIELSQTVSALADHSTDAFSTIKNLSVLVSALHDSASLMGQLNNNLRSVTSLVAEQQGQVGRAVADLNAAAGEITSFVADNRDVLGTTSDKLASISRALVDSIDDVEQTLHSLPNVVQNFNNIYDPAHGSVTGVLALNNFANPITFLCGAIQAASRLNSEQSSKLCVQYLAPIIKNRQYNFLPIGLNPFVNAKVRPNEVTYSEDWMRPDHRPNFVPPASTTPSGTTEPAGTPPPQVDISPAPEKQPVRTDPAAGLPGMMTLPGGAR